MTLEEKEPSNAVHYTIVGTQVVLPALWLGLGQEWAKVIWVGVMTVLSSVTLLVLAVRAISLHLKTKHHESFKFDPKMMYWPKLAFFLGLNVAFSIIMAKYADHPFIAALILVSYLAMIYEALFNNGEKA